MPLTFSETPDHIVIPTRVSLAAYADVLLSLVGNLALGAGYNELSLAAVPAGVLHVYTNLAIIYNGTVANVVLDCGIVRGAVDYVLYGQSPPVSGVNYDRQGMWVLEAGDVLRLRIWGATALDSARLCGTGFVVDLT